MARFCVLVVCASFALPSLVAAQRHVQYDTLSDMTPATVSCGFCAQEKFGVVFRELSAGGGLLASSFPLTVESLEVALASVRVDTSTYTCVGSANGGAVDTVVELYAGATPPTGDILSMPASGPWPGEELVWSDTVPIMRSVATMDGGMMYNVMFNQVDLPAGTRVETPGMTYLRAVVTIPASAATEGLCHLTDATYDEPSGVAIRDNERTEDELNFIYALETPPVLGPGLAEGWYWNEDSRISDGSGSSTIQGDWGLRLNIIPAATTPDAGPATPDAGSTLDAGSTPDAGPTPPMDGGTSTMCSGDGECAGGERCIEGVCRRVSCTAATDCAGGMTCVEGMCRNLCSADSECLGGEVCDTDMGHCVPAGSLDDDGGCGCRVTSRGDVPAWPVSLSVLAMLGLAVRSRRRR